MSLFEYSILILSVLAGGASAFFVSLKNDRILRLVLSFSGAYILGITVLHLLPGIYESGTSNVGFWIMCGFFLQLLLEQLSHGVEHGHVYILKNRTGLLSLQILIGLSVHAFLEGMPLSNYHLLTHHHEGHVHANLLLYGVVLHKAPAAFALALLFLQSGFSRKMVVTLIVGFALMSPLGAFIAEYFIPGTDVLLPILALVSGSFLHIATTIIFESDQSSKHHISLEKLLVIALGFGFAYLSHSL